MQYLAHSRFFAPRHQNGPLNCLTSAQPAILLRTWAIGSLGATKSCTSYLSKLNLAVCLENNMASRVLESILRSSRPSPHVKLAILCLFVSLVVAPLRAKNASLTAIELYIGPNGPAYVHITDVLINGKFELRVCDSTPKIDKSTYGRLAKVTLSAGASIEYGTDGVLTLKRDSTSSCVVPSDLKFD